MKEVIFMKDKRLEDAIKAITSMQKAFDEYRKKVELNKKKEESKDGRKTN